jgi:SMC interacting uncharacterized protein involved in chromosome segregation
VTDKWPSDKLENEMLADCHRVDDTNHPDRLDYVADLSCHVKALLERVRTLEKDRDELAEQVEVAMDRAQSWKNLCGRYKEVAESRGEKIDMDRAKCGMKYHHATCDCNGEGGDR